MNKLHEIEREIRSRHRPHLSFDAEAAVSPIPEGDDLEVVSRIVGSFRSYHEKEQNKATSMWEQLQTKHNSQELSTLKSGSIEDAAYILRNLKDNMLTYGMDNLCSAGTVGFAQPDILQKYIYLCQDNLLRLAEGLGGMWLDIPSAPDWCRFSATRTNDILTHIDSAVGVTIDFPNPFAGEYGLKTDRGVCCFRSISAIYLAFRVSQLCRGIDNPRVLEIGPGVGRSVYYAHRLGIEDYTCVDLPFPAGVVQSYYLMRTLGSEKVQLLGENADESKIRIIDPETFYAGTGYYDLIVNMDSLTEVGSPVAKKYLEMISRSCSKFLSINHESNGYRIRDMAMSSSVSGYTRHPDWLHPGYVEELVEFKHY